MSDWIIESLGSWGVKVTRSPGRYRVPKSGDVIDFGENMGIYPFTHGRYGRIEAVGTGVWCSGPGDVHICCELGSAFLFEDGHVDISGGPFTTVRLAELEPAYQLHIAEFWNWGHHRPGGGMGIGYHIARPVFRLLEWNRSENYG